MVSDAGGPAGYVPKGRQDVYRVLRRKGMTKKKAARIANAGASRQGRSRMAKKAAGTRKRRRRGR